MRLRTDSLDHALNVLRELDTGGQNVLGGLSGPYAEPRIRYLEWLDIYEQQLRTLFAAPDVLLAAHTERYWQIASAAVLDRMQQMVQAEVRHQLEVLAELATRVRGYLLMRERPGALILPDTNALLHFQRIDKVKWREVAGTGPVRLVIALPVLDELDDKRYLGSPGVKDKARSAVVPLDERQGELERDGVAELPDGTTVEYLIDERHHQRSLNPDEEILNRAEFLHLATAQPVTIATGDRGLRVRTTAMPSGVRARMMPAKYARDPDEAKFDPTNA